MNTGLEPLHRPPSEPRNFLPDDLGLSPLGSGVGDLSSFRFRPRSLEGNETNRTSMSTPRSPRLTEHPQSAGVPSTPQPGSSVAQLASLLTYPPRQRPAQQSSTPSNTPRSLASSPELSNNSNPMHPLPPVPLETHSQYPAPESVAPPIPQPPVYSNQWRNYPYTQSNYYGYGGYRHPAQPLQFPAAVPALPAIPTNDRLAYYSAPNLHYSGYPLPTQPIHAQSAPPPVAIRLQSGSLVAPFPTHGLHYSGYPLPTLPTPIYGSSSQPIVPRYPTGSRTQTPLPTSSDAHSIFAPPASRTATPQTRSSASPVEEVTSPQLQQRAGLNIVNYMVNVPGTDIASQRSLTRSSTTSSPNPFAPQTPAVQAHPSEGGEPASTPTSSGWIFEGPAVSFGRHLGTSPQVSASGNTIVVNMASNSTLNMYHEQRRHKKRRQNHNNPESPQQVGGGYHYATEPDREQPYCGEDFHLHSTTEAQPSPLQLQAPHASNRGLSHMPQSFASQAASVLPGMQSDPREVQHPRDSMARDLSESQRRKLHTRRCKFCDSGSCLIA